ncbi:hypothetical protein ACFYUJ_38920 [Streptomyces sp. NPDC004520]|uniref:hypothetical protein n=1 Tax=Streptomyces sp. NPDC004520 TaxID=3364702 RepID=UPI003698069D
MKLEPERMVLDLARDLAETRTTLSNGLEDVVSRLEELEGLDIPDAISGLRKVIGEIAVGLQALQAAAEEEEEEESEGPGTAPDWRSVDKEQCRELWDWLCNWCSRVLLPVYAQEVWKPCWYRHAPLRIQLTWLCAYYEWSYEKHAPPTRAAEWHMRWWPSMEKVIKKELANCGHAGDVHDPVHEIPGEMAYEEFADGGLAEWIDRDVARRPDPEKKGKAKKDPSD